MAFGNINNFGDYMKEVVLPRVGIKVAKKGVGIAVKRGRSFAAGAITGKSNAANMFKAALQTDMDQVRDVIEKIGASVAGSKVLAALASIQDAVIAMEDGDERLLMKDDIVPESFQFKVPERVVQRLESASADASTAFFDSTNVSVPLKVSAIKVQIFCTMLLTKDDPNTCVRLISKLLSALWADRGLKRAMVEKVKKFPPTKPATLEAKAAIKTFIMKIMHDLPHLHKLGFHVPDMPLITLCLATSNCIPLGWWEGLPVMWINGDSIYSLPWNKNIHVEVMDRKEANKGKGVAKYFDLNTFTLLPYTADTLQETSYTAIVDKEVYEKSESFKSRINKEDAFEYSTKSGEIKESFHCKIEFKEFINEGKCVCTPSSKIVVFDDEQFFVTWPLTSVKNVDWSQIKSDNLKPTQIVLHVEVKQKGATRLLYAEDVERDHIAVYALHDNAIFKHTLTTDTSYADYSSFVTIPPTIDTDFYLDLLQWSDINNALINVSSHDNGIFQFRLIDKNGNISSHSVATISDHEVFPPVFQWIQFDEIQTEELSMISKRENEIRKTVIFKNDCIFVSGSFRFDKRTFISY